MLAIVKFTVTSDQREGRPKFMMAMKDEGFSKWRHILNAAT